MKVLRENLVKMMVGLGYATAGKWDKAKMMTRLDEAVKMAADGEIAIEDPEDQELFDRIVAARGEEGEEIEVVLKESDLDEVAAVDDSDADATEETVEVKSPKAKKGSKEAKEPIEVKPPKAKKGPKDKKEPKAKKEQDKFGNRLGTKQAAFCACLSKKPKTMKELCEEAGCDTQYNLMRRLSKAGLVKASDGTYSLS